MKSVASSVEAVVIGGSAGAFDVLRVLVPALPRESAAPIIILLHVATDGPGILHEVLAHWTSLPVTQAEDKEPIVGGRIYVAPPGYHLLVERDRTFALSMDEPVNYSRPAIDVLFESAADAYGEGLMGVLLTGASSDGALGLQAIHRRGGTTVVQTPMSSEVALMPESAMRLFKPDHVLAPAQIASLLAGAVAAAAPTKPDHV